MNTDEKSRAARTTGETAKRDTHHFKKNQKNSRRYQKRWVSYIGVVNFALRTVAAEPLGVEEARRLRGSGWEGDLDELRTLRPA